MYALSVPCRRKELTWLGQIRLIRKIIYFTIVLTVLFIATSASMRWVHVFSVCCADLIPVDYYSQMEEYNYQVPDFYFKNTGFYIKVYIYFYVGAFCLFCIVGILLTLWITYQTTYKNVKLSNHPDFTLDEPEAFKLGQVVNIHNTKEQE